MRKKKINQKSRAARRRRFLRLQQRMFVETKRFVLFTILKELAKTF